MKKKILVLILILILSIMLTSCFPGEREISKDPAGFLSGIWHGWIAPLSLIVSLFKDNVNMYETYNNGFWYNFGFYIAILGGFGGFSLSRKNKKDD